MLIIIYGENTYEKLGIQSIINELGYNSIITSQLSDLSKGEKVILAASSIPLMGWCDKMLNAEIAALKTKKEVLILSPSKIKKINFKSSPFFVDGERSLPTLKKLIREFLTIRKNLL
ncbi:hypothetical protein [Vagococcus sp. WN89Y]|uniref:hypothetical protein n=1 Tax=Vagococcus sp. WN89Y TaxID=3457258 RepID=UPI003FCCF0C2